MNKIRHSVIKHRAKILLISVAIIIQSLFLQLSVPETVICLEEGGRIAVEKAGDGIHCHHPLTIEKTRNFSDFDSHASKCVDIPLDKNPEKTLARKDYIQIFLSIQFFVSYNRPEIHNRKPTYSNFRATTLKSPDILQGISLLI
jgi:hypothetical protein